MRSKFPGYYRPTKTEFDDIWKRGLVVPDTNILLHLLRFRRETRDEIIKTLKAFQPRLWLPNQIAFEFSRNWSDVEEDHRTSYAKLKGEIDRVGVGLAKLFDGVARFQIVDAPAEKNKVAKFIKDLCQSIDDASKNHPTLDEAERTVETVSALFDGVTSDAPDPKTLKQWTGEAAERYAKKIPPGFKDDNKQGDDKYSDYIIWREMIGASKAKSLPLLFLTDDRKEDWVSIRNGQYHGPRPELMQEFWKETGQRYYSYPLNVFLERAKDYIKVVVSKSAIKDVENHARRRRERALLEQQRSIDSWRLATLSEAARQANTQVSAADLLNLSEAAKYANTHLNSSTLATLSETARYANTQVSAADLLNLSEAAKYANTHLSPSTLATLSEAARYANTQVSATDLLNLSEAAKYANTHLSPSTLATLSEAARYANTQVSAADLLKLSEAAKYANAHLNPSTLAALSEAARYASTQVSAADLLKLSDAVNSQKNTDSAAANDSAEKNEGTSTQPKEADKGGD